MKVSVFSMVGDAFRFIFANYGSIWLLFIKLLLPILLIIFLAGGAVVSMIGTDALMSLAETVSMKGAPQVSMSQDVIQQGVMEQQGTELATSTDKLSKLPDFNMGTIIGMSFGTLVSYALILFLSAAMQANIIQSVVSGSKLNTALFSRLFDKDTLGYVKGALAMLFGVIFMVSIIAFLAVQIHVALSVLGIFVIWFMFRAILVPISLASGDSNSILEAWSSTSNNAFKAFLVILLPTLGLILINQVPGLLIALLGGIVELGQIVAAVSFLVLLPLQFWASVSIVYLYKHRQIS